MRSACTLPLSDRGFRLLLLFAVYRTFAALVASPFVLPYFLKQLHMTHVQVVVWSALSAVTALVLAPAWGRAV